MKPVSIEGIDNLNDFFERFEDVHINHLLEKTFAAFGITKFKKVNYKLDSVLGFFLASGDIGISLFDDSDCSFAYSNGVENKDTGVENFDWINVSKVDMSSKHGIHRAVALTFLKIYLGDEIEDSILLQLEKVLFNTDEIDDAKKHITNIIEEANRDYNERNKSR